MHSEVLAGVTVSNHASTDKESCLKIARIPILGSLLLVLAGCASPPVDKAPALPAVAVVINRTWTEQDPRGFAWEVRRDEEAEEDKFAACVSEAAASKDLPIQAVSGTRFRTLAFPDLDPRVAPRSLESLRSLIPDSRFQSRINAAGIRYIAIVGGETRTSETKGWIGCAAGYGGGGCFGYIWWDHDSRLSALIVDLHGGAELSKSGLDAAGTSWFSILAIFPLAAPSGHEAKGCARFGNAVAETIGEMHRLEK